MIKKKEKENSTARSKMKGRLKTKSLLEQQAAKENLPEKVQREMTYPGNSIKTRGGDTHRHRSSIWLPAR